MNIIKLFVKQEDYMEVSKYIREGKIRHNPFRKCIINGDNGYLIELDRDHAIVPFLILKFDLKSFDWSGVLV